MFEMETGEEGPPLLARLHIVPALGKHLLTQARQIHQEFV